MGMLIKVSGLRLLTGVDLISFRVQAAADKIIRERRCLARISKTLTKRRKRTN
jgi:hypothetical protein